MPPKNTNLRTIRTRNSAVTPECDAPSPVPNRSSSRQQSSTRQQYQSSVQSSSQTSSSVTSISSTNSTKGSKLVDLLNKGRLKIFDKVKIKIMIWF